MNDENKTRSKEIAEKYFFFLDQHIESVVSGETLNFFELNEIASKLAVSHQHLTFTIQKEFGNHPCHFYDSKIIDKAKKMILENDLPIAEIARRFTYDPSNFSKFFKKWTGITPGHFKSHNKLTSN